MDPTSHQLRGAIVDYLRDEVGMDDRWSAHHGRVLARTALQIAGRDALAEATRCRRMLDHEVARSREAQAELVALRVALHRYAVQEDDGGAAARAVLRGFLADGAASAGSRAAETGRRGARLAVVPPSPPPGASG